MLRVEMENNSHAWHQKEERMKKDQLKFSL